MRDDVSTDTRKKALRAGRECLLYTYRWSKLRKLRTHLVRFLSVMDVTEHAEKFCDGKYCEKFVSFRPQRASSASVHGCDSMSM